MKLVLDKKHENRIEFLASDVQIEFANMIRRYTISRVPVLAIDNVTFYDNTSAFWDEYISHRLGLLPVITPEKLPKNAEILFSLDAEGPKTVYTADFTSTDEEIKVAKNNIPIATLGPQQRLRLEGKAVLGTATTHAKFQAGLVGYGEEEKGLRMFVESFFQMQPSEVLIRGCNSIISDLNDLESALKKK
ncbi:DNA-directed RNA polymerase subunit D [Candidatus Micrarchaeota archaeon]|nr:DNA-directed RNA polymerase subunit D [Candidatus Micrarchaeota archaeon]